MLRFWLVFAVSLRFSTFKTIPTVTGVGMREIRAAGIQLWRGKIPAGIKKPPF
jgi:hypothetical protein